MSKALPGAEARPYSHQPYPSIRFHADGSTTRLVKSADEDNALGEAWSDTPFAPAVKPAGKPEPSPAEKQLAEAQKLVKGLQTENDDLTSLVREQNAELRELRKLKAELLAKIAELQSDASKPGEDTAASAPAETPALSPAPAPKAKKTSKE